MRPLEEGFLFSRMICKFTFHCSNVCSREEGKSCPAFTMRPMDSGAASEYNRAPNVAIGSSWSVFEFTSHFETRVSYQMLPSHQERQTVFLGQACKSRPARYLRVPRMRDWHVPSGPAPVWQLQMVRVVACSESITTTFFDGKVEPMRVNVAVEAFVL